MAAARRSRLRAALLAGMLLGLPALAAAAPPPATETRFMAENQAAMGKMMTGMDIKPSGDVSKDFVAMMSAHHQGAVDMAKTYLRYGQNEQLRRISQEIIVEQTQELAAMRQAIGLPPPASAPAPTQIPAVPSAMPHHALEH